MEDWGGTTGAGTAGLSGNGLSKLTLLLYLTLVECCLDGFVTDVSFLWVAAGDGGGEG